MYCDDKHNNDALYNDMPPSPTPHTPPNGLRGVGDGAIRTLMLYCAWTEMP